jgi:hypothetical protein
METQNLIFNYEHGGNLKALVKALTSAQSALDPVVKSSLNAHFKNAYANIDEILTAVLPALQAHGLLLTQHPGGDGHLKASMTTALYHEEGGFIISTASCAIAKPDAQKTMAAFTYLRRGSIQAILSLPAADDDGNTAAGADLRSVLEHCRKYSPSLSLAGLCGAAENFGFGALEDMSRKDLGQLVRRMKEELHG